MSLQTYFLRKSGKKIVSAIHHPNGKWSGIEHVKHPTPSGWVRLLPTFSDNREWPTKKIALQQFKKLLIQVDKAYAKLKLD